MKPSAYSVLTHPLLKKMPDETEWPEFIKVLMGGVLSKTTSTGNVADIRALGQSVLSNRPSVMLAAAITGTDDGGVPTIDIAAHTVTFTFGDVIYNAGTVIVSTFGITYYVFASDPNYEGGTVTYFAFDSPDEGVSDDYRYVGAVTMPILGDPPVSGGYGGAFGTGTEPVGGASWP